MHDSWRYTYIANIFWGQSKGEGAWLFALNASDGHELWRRQLTDTTSRGILLDLDNLPPVANHEAFFMTLDENRDTELDDLNEVLTAFSAVDGSDLWHFPVNQRGYYLTAPTVQDNLVFVIDLAPRWRNWLASLNLAQHN